MAKTVVSIINYFEAVGFIWYRSLTIVLTWSTTPQKETDIAN
jgi:hypothetical protein